MAHTLREFFGDRVEFGATSSSSTTTRRFTSFSRAVDEIVDARVYSGIHFRIADVHGALIGREIVDYATERYFEPKDDDDREDESDAAHLHSVGAAGG